MIEGYFQFLRIYSSKFVDVHQGYPRLAGQTILKNLRYSSEGLVEDDVSILFNLSSLSATSSISVGFSKKRVQLQASVTNTSSNELLEYLFQNHGANAWAKAMLLRNSRSSKCVVASKKYILKTPVLLILRKLLRQEGVDFYLDHVPVVVSWCLLDDSQRHKVLEAFIRFYGFPLRITQI